TEAGCRYAAECRYLFKWPAAQSAIRPESHYAGRFRCLIHLHNELVRLGMTTRDLSQVQQFLLGDLECGFDEEALADMHEPVEFEPFVHSSRTSARRTSAPCRASDYR